MEEKYYFEIKINPWHLPLSVEMFLKTQMLCSDGVILNSRKLYKSFSIIELSKDFFL